MHAASPEIGQVLMSLKVVNAQQPTRIFVAFAQVFKITKILPTKKSKNLTHMTAF